MQLSEFEISNIKTLPLHHFVKDVQFSCLTQEPLAKSVGGDINLFICNSNGDMLKIRTKINFVIELILQFVEQKIDVVLDNPILKMNASLRP